MLDIFRRVRHSKLCISRLDVTLFWLSVGHLRLQCPESNTYQVATHLRYIVRLCLQHSPHIFRTPDTKYDVRIKGTQTALGTWVYMRSSLRCDLPAFDAPST